MKQNWNLSQKLYLKNNDDLRNDKPNCVTNVSLTEFFYFEISKTAVGQKLGSQTRHIKR